MNYIEQILHTKTRISALNEAHSFPLYLKAAYEFSALSIGDTDCILMVPKEQASLSALRKQYHQVEVQTGKICVLQLEKLSKYTEQRLIEDGIAFFISGGTVYLPFLAVYFASMHERKIIKPERISFLAQKLLLTALYERWDGRSVTETAKILGVTEMSVSRAFDDVEAVSLPFIVRNGRKRIFTPGMEAKTYLERIWPVLRDPVIAIYRLENIRKSSGLRFCGISAISHYSMLSEESFPVYGITREQSKSLSIERFVTTNYEEDPAAIAMMMRYSIDYGDGKAVDPISAILSLRDDELSDPRVEKAVDEIKERLAK